jgi:cobalt-zinc-cadmium efflux system outer membrane protein
MKNIRRLILIFLFNPVFAQTDTLKLSLNQADSLFLNNNLLLLAQRFRISADQALIQQAKVWSNPNLTAEFNAYNPVKRVGFDVGNTGEKIFSIQQLIYLAGKRSNRIRIAENTAQLTELEFADLLRSLKVELRQRFYAFHFNSFTLQLFNNQLTLLKTIIEALDNQNKKGNVSLKEVLRLKAVYFQLSNDRTELLRELLDEQLALQNLLRTTQSVMPVVNDESLTRYDLQKVLQTDLISMALENRPDMKISQRLTEQAQLNYRLQKSMAVPDLTLGAVYDQSGSYINNYTGITVGIDLPVWNRNQGNIRYAKAISESQLQYQEQKTLSIKNEVSNSLKSLQGVEQEYKNVDKNFGSDFDLLNKGFIENFQKRNISLIEFVDFFEAYNDSVRQLNRLRTNRIQAYEELNFIVGVELFK